MTNNVVSFDVLCSDFKGAITADIKSFSGSEGRSKRKDIANKISALTQIDVSEDTLYNWSARSHENHQMNAIMLPAFVIATGGQHKALDVLVKAAGRQSISSATMLRYEIQQLKNEMAVKMRVLNDIEK